MRRPLRTNLTGTLRICFAVLLIALLTAGLAAACVSGLKTGTLQMLLTSGTDREDMLTDTLPQKQTLLAPAQFTDSLLGRRYFAENDYLLRPDGQITLGSGELIGPAAADHVKELYDVCLSENKDFLYVLLPGKPVDDDDFHQYGLPCYRNQNADTFLSKLKEYGIPHLDLRPVILTEAELRGDPYALFYKSDHHWTADAGLIAAREIAAALNEKYNTGLDVQALRDDRFTREEFPVPAVGQTGAKLLGAFGSSDRLIVRRPKYDVALHYFSPERGADRTGGFDSVFWEDRLPSADESHNILFYYYYMGSDDHLGFIERQDGGDSSLLLIKDSFSCVVTPFLALTAGRVTWWDMRKDKAVLEYIREHPEIKAVVLMYHISFSVSTPMNDFQ